MRRKCPGRGSCIPPLEHVMAGSTRKTLLLTAVSGLALVGADGLGTKVAVERSVGGFAADIGATVATVDANPLNGRIALSDAVLARDGGRLTVGRIVLRSGPALMTPALAADTVTLENVAIEIDALTYRMPRIEVAGSNLG